MTQLPENTPAGVDLPPPPAPPADLPPPSVVEPPAPPLDTALANDRPAPEGNLFAPKAVPFISGWGPRDRSAVTRIEGGVTAPKGFRAGGAAVGLKKSGRPDLALVVADEIATAAAVSTTNKYVAAPVVLSNEHLRNGHARVVVVNAGNANACTGPQGDEDARAMAVAIADAVGCDPTDVVVMSTGVIGVPMPVAKVVAGIPTVVADLGSDLPASARAADAICTTDTVLKQIAVRVTDELGTCVIGGMIKGAGMIEPAMATMLGVITTDAKIPAPILRSMLRTAATSTFNRISIDACGSTNDMVVALASGSAPTAPSLETLQLALTVVCADLAAAVVADGEETTKTVVIRVKDAATELDAEDLARAVASSVLVRAALAGADPNWGRILAALGAAQVDFEPRKVSVRVAGMTVCRFGVAATFDRDQASWAMQRDIVEVEIDMGAGTASATMLTADLTTGYVHFNSAYTT